ncbi:MAG: hypothetical protein M3137_05140 [Actinomycetota bacterium]|nr:hypothetical protein [Actinomycetota bacterium]
MSAAGRPRSAESVLDGGDEAWLVTRYADGHAVLSDARLAIWFPGMPKDGVLDEEGGGFLFVMNGPHHLRVRRALGAAMGGVHAHRVRRLYERAARCARPAWSGSAPAGG